MNFCVPPAFGYANSLILGFFPAVGTLIHFAGSRVNGYILEIRIYGEGLKNRFKYRGYIYDDKTGFYYMYMQSRYYDPVVKCFISADESDYLGADGSFTSFNLFAYCGNNPVMSYNHVFLFSDYSFDGQVNLWGHRELNGCPWTDGINKTTSEAEENIYDAILLIIAAEHHKKGTTGRHNRQKHEEGQARKQMDQNGEKGDSRRKPNPNKRPKGNNNAKKASDVVVSGVIIVGSIGGIVYLCQ